MTFTTQIKDEITKDNYASPDALISLCIYLKLNSEITDNSITTKKVEKYFDRNIEMVLYFERKKEVDTKNGEKMMFISASDSFGNAELVMFPKTYNKFFNIPIPGVYKINGKVEKRFSKLQIVVYLATFASRVSIKCLEVSKKHPELSELAGAER